MKKYITYLMILMSAFAYSQITIGKTVNSGLPANTSVSLEFGNPTGGQKGIVLPWVTIPSGVTSAVPGTLIFDSRATFQKVRLARANTAGSTSVVEWFDFSDGALLPAVQNVADAGSDLPTAKVLIGGTATTPSTDAAPGILVLGDNTKAMILPRVGSIADIVNPSAGMMVYVTGANNNGTDPNANQLAVFNGREWAFWSKQ